MIVRIITLALMSTVLLLSVTGSAYGLSANQKNIFDSGIYYFDASTSDSVSCTDGTDLIGGPNAEKVFRFFLAKGFSAVQSAAIVGNFMQESGVSTTSKNPKSGAYGIANWLGGRLEGLKKFAADNNKDINNLDLQRDYALYELNNGEKAAADDLKKQTDLESATLSFRKLYERPGEEEADDAARLRYAKDVLTKYGSGAVGTNAGFSDCVGLSISLDPNFTMTRLIPPLTTPGGKITPKGITLHWWGSGSNGQGINALVSYLHSNSSCPESACSVQVGITADGKVYQMTNDLLDLTYHATGGNQTTIGIEIEGGPDDFKQAGVTKYPQKFAAVVATVKYLVAKYNIPLDGQVVCGDVVGIHPHKAYNSCTTRAKEDIDDDYFNAVMQAVRS